MTVFMERLQLLMDNEELSDRDLIQMLGLSKNAITNWRNGMKPQSSTVHRLADFFSVSYDWLRGIDGPKNEIRKIISKSDDPILDELIKMYKECDPQSQTYLAHVIWQEWDRCRRMRNEKPYD